MRSQRRPFVSRRMVQTVSKRFSSCVHYEGYDARAKSVRPLLHSVSIFPPAPRLDGSTMGLEVWSRRDVRLASTMHTKFTPKGSLQGSITSTTLGTAMAMLGGPETHLPSLCRIRNAVWMTRGIQNLRSPAELQSSSRTIEAIRLLQVHHERTRMQPLIIAQTPPSHLTLLRDLTLTTCCLLAVYRSNQGQQPLTAPVLTMLLPPHLFSKGLPLSLQHHCGHGQRPKHRSNR